MFQSVAAYGRLILETNEPTHTCSWRENNPQANPIYCPASSSCLPTWQPGRVNEWWKECNVCVLLDACYMHFVQNMILSTHDCHCYRCSLATTTSAKAFPSDFPWSPLFPPHLAFPFYRSFVELEPVFIFIIPMNLKDWWILVTAGGKWLCMLPN